MDEKFLELLAKLDEDIASLSNDELVEARHGLVEAGKQLGADIKAGEVEDAEKALEDVDRLAAAVKAIDTESETRTAAAAETDAKLAESMSVFDDEATEPVEETEEAVAEEPPTEAKAKVASVADIARRRKPPAPQPARPLVASAVGGSGSTQMGQAYGDHTELAQAMWDAHRRGPNGAQTVARVRLDTPFQLGSDEEANYNLVEQVKRDYQREAASAMDAGRPLATVAAGFCAPAQPVYDYLQAGSRDGIFTAPELTASRGRFTFPELFNIRDLQVQNGVAWESTSTMDEDAVEKPCYTVACGDGITAQVSAYSDCIKFSNFDSQFWPERVTHVTGQVAIAHDHEVNLALLLDIVGDARTETAIDGFTNGGTWAQTIQSVALHGAYVRNRYRLPINSVLEAIIPAYVLDALIADQVARSATTEYGMARAAVEAAFARARISVQWVYDWQELAAANWPAAFNYLLWPAGHVLKLNGGTLNLGVVRDSTLNVANDFQVFNETFDGHAIVGPGVMYVTGVNLCPNGEASSNAALSCAAGS
jgi:hypothetical protein